MLTSPHKSTAPGEHQHPPLLPGSAREKGEWLVLLFQELEWVSLAEEHGAAGLTVQEMLMPVDPWQLTSIVSQGRLYTFVL